MSLATLALVLGPFAMFGKVHEADEGATAHIWQLLMARRLCDYAHQRLLQAHVHQSAKMLQEVIDLIQPISEAWATVERRSAAAV